MSKYIGPLTDTIIDSLIREINKEANRKKIIDGVIPLLCDLASRYHSYWIVITSSLVAIIVLLLLILVITIIKK